MAGDDISFTTGDLGAALGAEVVGRADLPISDLAPMDRAGPRSLTFIRSAEYARHWGACQAAAALITRGLEAPGHDPAARALLIVDDADLALARALELIAEREAGPAPAPGTHPSAVVEEGADIAPGAHIGPGCVVRRGAVIGDGATLIAQVFIGRGARIGERVTLHPGVRVLDNCEIGAGTIIHANSVIGADGFGYRPAPDGRSLVKIPHIGSVKIGRDVEIGACSCVDRGKLGATVVGDGTKIDNLVQIGHNSEVGRSVIMCGQSGLGGSVRIGDGCVLGGRVAVIDNLTVGAGTRLAGGAGVMNDVPAGVTWLGAPAQDARIEAANLAAARKLAETLRDMRKAIRRLEERA